MRDEGRGMRDEARWVRRVRAKTKKRPEINSSLLNGRLKTIHPVCISMWYRSAGPYIFASTCILLVIIFFRFVLRVNLVFGPHDRVFDTATFEP
jgi:hypothetical protein